jgi:hypothetical protein
MQWVSEGDGGIPLFRKTGDAGGAPSLGGGEVGRPSTGLI